LTTLEVELADELRELEWRRRESNPRPQTIDTERQLRAHLEDGARLSSATSAEYAKD